ncbi:pseudouridylate synthase RPUSD4, mitochondrial [Ascaphus truei]|uniref:pseudouridylate synthase RPUSD4, mitochondrial n=1 Tax=Ascaphus truei TaxID=8439 RepID=UPI003F5911D3
MAEAGGCVARGARALAERIRAERSQGPQRGQSDFTRLLLRELRNRVLHRDGDIVLINKPHGVSVHGGPSVRCSVASVLPAFSQMLFGRGAEPLRLCHRLDKDTTGALILARSAEAAERVQELLRERKAHKVYW